MHKSTVTGLSAHTNYDGCAAWVVLRSGCKAAAKRVSTFGIDMELIVV